MELILPIGISGSGKSRLYKKEYSDYKLVSPDEIRKFLTGNISDQSKNNEVFERVDNLIEKDEKKLSFFDNEQNEKQEKLDKVVDELKQKYGYSSSVYDNDEKVLHSTLSADRFTPIANTGNMLRIHCRPDGIYIESQDVIEDIFWSREALRKCFEKKYKNKFVYAKALTRGTGSNEEFHFIEAYEVSGFDYDAFITLLETGKIYVDLRIGQYHNGKNKGKTHDHGTGFRIREIDQPLLFKVQNRIV